MSADAKKCAVTQLCWSQVAKYGFNIIQTVIVTTDQCAPAIDALIEIIKKEYPLERVVLAQTQIGIGGVNTTHDEGLCLRE